MKKNVEDYLREYFKQEWLEDEIRKALCIIQEVLICHDTDDPSLKHDHEIALALTDEEVVEDIVKEYSKNVPCWTEEALQFANDHDIGVWRRLYDAIVPSLRFARRLGTRCETMLGGTTDDGR